MSNFWGALHLAGGAIEVQQKMNICNKIARKFTFECDFVTNGLHYATVASGELLKRASEAASEGTTGRLMRGRSPHIFSSLEYGLHCANVASRRDPLSGRCNRMQ